MNEPEMPEIEKFGLYQFGMCLAIGIPVLFNACTVLSYVFTAGEMNYRCLITECEDVTNTSLYPSWLENAVPYTDGTPETCSRYVVQNLSEICSETTFNNSTQTCDTWVYDPKDETILSEWDLTCSRNQWKLTLVGTMNNVGQFVALTYAGTISDRYGRRTLLVISMVASAICGLIQSFSVNYWMYVTFVFLDTALAEGVYSSAFLMGVELVGPSKRVLGGTIVGCLFAVGEIILALIAMSVVSWRTLIRIIYIPLFGGLLLPFIVPESIRWLIARGKDEQADKTIRKIARMNGYEVTDEAIRKFKELQTANSENAAPAEISTAKSPVKQVLGSPIILTRLVICAFCWVTNTFVYYGLSLNSVYMPGDKYISFILVAAIEIPGYLIGLLAMDRLGRKPTLSGFFLLSGAFCLVFASIPSDSSTYLLLGLFMAGKCCITAAFSTTYVQTAEMFPTTLRHSLLGGCSMVGRIGSMLAPQTPLLANVMESLPMILFGVVAVTAGLLSLTFPETVGTQLPTTVYEAERIGKTLYKEKEEHSSS